jgi:hypothetical protein
MIKASAELHGLGEVIVCDASRYPHATHVAVAGSDLLRC